MPKLRTLTASSVNALSVPTLHKVGQLFSKLAEHFFIKPCPELETCELNARKVPAQAEMRELYENYKSAFLDALDSLSAASEKDVEVILLAHYLHISFTNEDYASTLESICKDVPRISCSSIEYVARVMLTPGKRLRLSQASMQLSSSARHSFTYYTKNLNELTFKAEPLYEPGVELNTAYETEVFEFLKKKYNTEICHVQSQKRDHIWIIEVTHGGMLQKEQKEEKAQPVDTVRQPIETDCIIYDTNYGDVRIHMEKGCETSMAQYHKCLGSCLFENPQYWHNKPKYGLDVFGGRQKDVQDMLLRGADRLKNSNSGAISLDISSITYTIERKKANGEVYVTKHTMSSKQGVNNTVDEEERLVPAEATISSVTLKFSYGIKKSKSLSITITQRKRTLESEVIPGIEDWLKDEHVF